MVVSTKILHPEGISKKMRGEMYPPSNGTLISKMKK
jgi:hypothetical protein